MTHAAHARRPLFQSTQRMLRPWLSWAGEELPGAGTQAGIQAGARGHSLENLSPPSQSDCTLRLAAVLAGRSRSSGKQHYGATGEMVFFLFFLLPSAQCV